MNARQAEIVNLIQKEQRVGVRELAERFGVSEMTVRRDLSEMEKQGLLIRTHGGGVAAGRLRFLQSAFPQLAASPEKAAIGKLAAGLVKPGQTVMVDSGTTALEVALHLPQDIGITVATTSLCVAQALYGTDLNVLILGGFLRKDFPSLYGPVTHNVLDNLRADMLFIGCDAAVSEEGFYTADMHISSLEQAMIGIADRVVVVTESRKFGQRAFVRYAQPEEVDVLVTNSGLTPGDRSNLEQKGVRVLIAEKE